MGRKNQLFSQAFSLEILHLNTFIGYGVTQALMQIKIKVLMNRRRKMDLKNRLKSKKELRWRNQKREMVEIWNLTMKKSKMKANLIQLKRTKLRLLIRL